MSVVALALGVSCAAAGSDSAAEVLVLHLAPPVGGCQSVHSHPAPARAAPARAQLSGLEGSCYLPAEGGLFIGLESAATGRGSCSVDDLFIDLRVDEQGTPGEMYQTTETRIHDVTETHSKLARFSPCP